MRYAVCLHSGKENCFPENMWSELNNFEILSKHPHNNVLFEHEFEDITIEDLIEIDGEIKLDKEKYLSSRSEKGAETLRARRNRLLKGWDIYTSNAAFGVYQITDNEKEVMVGWYVDILDMKVAAINNPPKIIKYLIGEKEE